MTGSPSVAFVITGLSYGGAETQLARLATSLRERAWSVRVVSMLPPEAYTDELAEAGVQVVSLSMHRGVPDPRALLRLAGLLRRWRPDIVHGFMVHANLLARVARLLAPVPILVSSARNVDEGGRWREIAYRLTDPLSDITTQVSRAGAERYVRIGAVPEGKIRVMPNGVDTRVFRPSPECRQALRDGLGLEGSFAWLAVGRFEPAKDYQNLLRAFAHALSQEPTAVLLLVGQGSLREEIEQLAEDLHVAPQVRFLGTRRDIPSLMNASDAYVMSSAWEGMPNVLLEAGASGLPAVATDVGGNSEVIVDGETGFLVAPGDSDQLAAAMRRMMELPSEMRMRMGEAGRRRIDGCFGLDHVVRMWEGLYHELLARRVR